MNKKIALLIPGALALAVSLMPLVPAFSQESGSRSEIVAQRRGGKPDLNLTEQQRQQMRQIREETRAQIEAVLTPEQRAKLEAAREQRQNPREVMASLNLTEQQRAQMRTIREESKRKMDAVLTEQQRQQLEQMRQQRQQQRQQPGGAGR